MITFLGGVNSYRVIAHGTGKVIAHGTANVIAVMVLLTCTHVQALRS